MGDDFWIAVEWVLMQPCDVAWKCEYLRRLGAGVEAD